MGIVSFGFVCVCERELEILLNLAVQWHSVQFFFLNTFKESSFVILAKKIHCELQSQDAGGIQLSGEEVFQAKHPILRVSLFSVYIKSYLSHSKPVLTPFETKDGGVRASEGSISICWKKSMNEWIHEYMNTWYNTEFLEQRRS